MRTRGRFLNKEYYFSICSAHSKYDENCNMCNHGHWTKAYKHKISSFIWWISPSLWRWWINKF